MTRPLLALLAALLALPAASAPAPVAPLLSLPALHVKLAAPRGWLLNDSHADHGWVSFYAKSLKDPSQAAIDVFYYPKGGERGSPESYVERLPPAEKAAAKVETVGGRKAWVAAIDYKGVADPHSTKARAAARRRVLIVLGRDDGVVVLRLEALKSLAPKEEPLLRRLAASVQPL